ncbi:phospholipid carrier-dependent glycosyltransferase [Leucobacter denitrificans]|uniref:Polyprenol-phosphate-mannose--protein mannosyltransferase n=1 Tax=Leucobacter denitrificans TaxID=683042 RepID=A0A7G9S839_9MICO|nr:phospholipid carrier-dependent glycosyltransferase [Leucobacter denitrificans]
MLAIASLARFWALAQPGSLVFDELYYVRDAISQLAYGYPTNWPDDDTRMGATFLSSPDFAVHPPLGKWLIGLGVLLFGEHSAWGWRFAVAAFGVATVGVTMRLAWLMSRNTFITLIAGLVLAVDGVHITLTRVSLLDGFLTFFVVLGALFVWRDHVWVVDRTTPSHPEVLWWRPWLFAAAVAFGCAASVKWSGLYPLAAFLLLITARDVAYRLRSARTHGASQVRAWGRALLQAAVAGLIALPTTLAMYIASWSGWIVTAGGWGRGSGSWISELWAYHVDIFAWHSTLSAPHPYRADPLTWPLALRPTGMYEATVGDGYTAAISSIPNPVVIIGGVVALIVLAWWIARRSFPDRVWRVFTPGTLVFTSAFVLTGYLSGWIPWILTFSRPAVFQFYAVVLTPFAAIAIALVIGEWCRLLPRARGGRDANLIGESGESGLNGEPGEVASEDASGSTVGPDAEVLLGRRLAAALFIAAALILAVLFFPVWSGEPIPNWFWHWHHWLPGWD